jgi:hypothetical protein
MHAMEVTRALVALLAGSVIGVGFGYLQQAAVRRNEARQRDGTIGTGWSLMPGSGARVAYLLLALIVVQLICPILFADGIQWWVSGGLLLGYGWTLLHELRRRMRTIRN